MYTTQFLGSSRSIITSSSHGNIRCNTHDAIITFRIIKSCRTACLGLLLMLGALWAVLTLVFGGLSRETFCNDGSCDWFRPCSSDRSSDKRECRGRSFTCCCPRLLREAGRLRKSVVKTLLRHGKRKNKTCPPRGETCLDKQVFGFCVTLFASSSSKLEKSADDRTSGIRLCEYFTVFGSQKWLVAKRFGCELLSVIQYGGQDGCSPDEEGDC